MTWSISPTMSHFWKFYPKPASHLLGCEPWAHWEWLYGLHGGTLIAQFPDRGEYEAQPGRLSIMFKQRELDWLWHLYNSN